MLALLWPAMLAAAAAPRVTPAEVSAMLDSVGSARTVERLGGLGDERAPTRFDAVLDGIASGDPAWLALRALRIGAINYHVQRKLARTAWSRTRLCAKMLALLPQSLFLAVGLLLREHKTLIALHPIIVAAGSALAAIGIEPQPYKASKIVS